MPVQSTDLADTLTYTAQNQTWLIRSWVVVSSADGEGVRSDFMGSSLVNHGVVLADSNTGVRMTGTNGYIHNATGAEIAGGNGVVLQTGSAVVNRGAIAAFGAVGYGIDMLGNAQVVNSGEIYSRYVGIGIGFGGAGNSMIDNSGLISGGSRAAVLTTVTGASILINSGTIVGAVELPFSSYSSVTNTGTIFGATSLSAATSRVVNSGDIFGDVSLLDGANLFDGRRGAMNGYSVIGGVDSDIMKGGADDDLFRGSNGLDTLTGKGGDDVLIGGGLADRLSGGAGADSFVYEARSDSTPAVVDTITDFNRAEGDVIDLSPIDADKSLGGNQAFTFISTSAFTNTAGELRYAVPGSSAIVSGDVDGDGTADFAILVANVTDLKEADFVL